MNEKAQVENRDIYKTYKIILCGDSGVGKTSLIKKYVDKTVEPNEQHFPTIGVELITKMLNSDLNCPVRIQIWDTAGQEKYHSIISNYFKKAQGVLLVFDITDRNSFTHASTWLQEVRNYANSDAVVFLVGNKKDLKEKRQVKFIEAQDFTRKNHIVDYYESSIFDKEENDFGMNSVETIFSEMVRTVDKNFERGVCKRSSSAKFINLDKPDSKNTLNKSLTVGKNSSCNCCE